jgi:hypothetical protein
VTSDWLVRGTSRRPGGFQAIEAAGLDAAEADPDRPGSVLDLCGDVGVVVWLLGSAVGGREDLAAIHGPRLERLLEKLVDSPVRGFAYEAMGSVDEEMLQEGRWIVERAAERWRIPVTVLTGRREEDGWAERTANQVAGLLG